MDAVANVSGRVVGRYPPDARNINPDLGALFVHNPRCAGRSILTALGMLGSHEPQGALFGRYADHLADFFKFAVVRHPLERYLSAYRWRQQEKKIRESEHRIDLRRLRGVSLEECTRILLDEPEMLVAHLAPQSFYIPEPNKLDYLIRYEDLATGWKVVCHRLRVSIELPRINVSNGDVKPSSFVIESVARMYKDDYLKFGYQMPRIKATAPCGSCG